MNYLVIKNQGLLDVEALTLLGASTKGSESNKIGRFGSGNKFALAYLMRNGHELTIYSGTQKIELTTISKTFRDKTFEIICVNGKETSITTDFGKDWELWQAIREIYCNAIDEGNYGMEYVNSINPEEGYTKFYIKNNDKISSFVANFDNYFSENKEVLFSNEEGEILEKGSGSKINLYRKGIRCYESETKSIFDYNFNNITITEDRLVKYSWELPSKIWNLILKCTNKEVIKKVLINSCESRDFIEFQISPTFSSLTSSISEEFKEVIKSLKVCPVSMGGLLGQDEIGNTVLIPTEIYRHCSDFLDNENRAKKFKIYKDSFYEEIFIDNLSQATIDKCLNFFEECNYLGPLEYPIVLARFEKKEILGFADMKNKCIVLSENCISGGVQKVIETIIEEYIHLKYDVKDETRSFQDASIQELVTVLKIKNSYLV